MKVAINGFGRIGRNFLRAWLKDKDAQKAFSIKAINCGSADINSIAHFFKYDTIMGTYPASVTINERRLLIDNYSFDLITQKDISRISWKEYEVDWVVECTGCFTHREDAQKHRDSGASHVLISAPAHDEDISIIPGINHNDFKPDVHALVSLGSCTTNALIPLLSVIDASFSIVSGMMTTVHAYTNTQVLLDVEDTDLRRARAAALNIIPTSTGSSSMIKKFFPDLAGKFDAISLRVPVAKVSLIDCVMVLKKSASAAEINAAFREAKQKTLKTILDTSTIPLVSSDYAGNDHSVVIDELLTVSQGSVCKVFGWYDNEWGYSVRLKDFLMFVSRTM